MELDFYLCNSREIRCSLNVYHQFQVMRDISNPLTIGPANIYTIRGDEKIL